MLYLFPFSSAIMSSVECIDMPECKDVTKVLCNKSEPLRNKCPVVCGTCCKDQGDCKGVTSAVCKLDPHFKKTCAKSCGLCGGNKPHMKL